MFDQCVCNASRGMTVCACAPSHGSRCARVSLRLCFSRDKAVFSQGSTVVTSACFGGSVRLSGGVEIRERSGLACAMSVNKMDAVPHRPSPALCHLSDVYVLWGKLYGNLSEDLHILFISLVGR